MWPLAVVLAVGAVTGPGLVLGLRWVAMRRELAQAAVRDTAGERAAEARLVEIERRIEALDRRMPVKF